MATDTATPSEMDINATTESISTIMETRKLALIFTFYNKQIVGMTSASVPSISLSKAIKTSGNSLNIS